MSKRVVANPSPEKIVYLTNRHTYERYAVALDETSSIFVSEMDSKQAWYAKKRFENILGKTVDYDPVDYDGVSGYQFQVRQKPQPQK